LYQHDIEPLKPYRYDMTTSYCNIYRGGSYCAILYCSYCVLHWL